MPDPHFVPNPHTHRRAFFGIDRVASQVLLIQTGIDLIDPAEESNQRGLRPQPQPKEMEPRFRNDAETRPNRTYTLALPSITVV